MPRVHKASEIRDAGRLFGAQVAVAIELGFSRLYNKSPTQFTRWLTPLRGHAIKEKSVGELPFLLVFPHTSLGGGSIVAKRRKLIRNLRWEGKPVVVEHEHEDPRYLSWFKDSIEMPTLPYLAYSIIGGEEYGLGEGEEPDANFALDEIAKQKRLPLTLDEGLWLTMFCGPRWSFGGLRLLATAYTGGADEAWADVVISEEGLVVSDHEKDCFDAIAEHWAPSCVKRVALLT